MSGKSLREAEESLARLSAIARRDEALRKRLLDTRAEPDKSTNGGATYPIDDWDDAYSQFFAGLE